MAGFNIWSDLIFYIFIGYTFHPVYLFSWFYGRDLFETLNYPIGLMATAYGGTPIEAWSSPAALAKCPQESTASDHETSAPEERFVTAAPTYTSDSVLWNAMIVPFLKTTIKGAIWYERQCHHLRSSSCIHLNLISIFFVCICPDILVVRGK